MQGPRTHTHTHTHTHTYTHTHTHTHTHTICTYICIYICIILYYIYIMYTFPLGYLGGPVYTRTRASCRVEALQQALSNVTVRKMGRRLWFINMYWRRGCIGIHIGMRGCILECIYIYIGVNRYRHAACRVATHYVRSCHITSRHITSRHVTSGHIRSRHITSRQAKSRHVRPRGRAFRRGRCKWQKW